MPREPASGVHDLCERLSDTRQPETPSADPKVVAATAKPDAPAPSIPKPATPEPVVHQMFPEGAGLKSQADRWHDYRIGQLTFSINLFLTFAVAALGYTLGLMRDATLVVSHEAHAVLVAAQDWLVVSVASGASASYLRFWDFWATSAKHKYLGNDWRKGVGSFFATFLPFVTFVLFHIQLVGLGLGAWKLLSVVQALGGPAIWPVTGPPHAA